MADNLRDFPPFVRKLSDSQFFQMLVRSIDSREVEGVTFPAFPDEQLQASFVGSAGKDALSEAYQFWQLLKSKSSQLGRPLQEATNVLDFGCGWGRYLRFLNKDVRTKNLYGVDVNPEIIELCKSLGVPGNLSMIAPQGTLPFPDGFFDVAMAYSVFTHLPEQIHLHWMKELTRVCRQGAVCVMTLEPRRFIEFVRDEAPKGSSGWHRGLATFAPIADRLLAQFDAGEFVYVPTGGGAYLPSSTYGDAVTPVRWLTQHWIDWTLDEYIDNPRRFWQAVAVVKRT